MLVVRVTTWFAWTLKATRRLVEVVETVSYERENLNIYKKNYYIELKWILWSMIYSDRLFVFTLTG